MYPGRSRTTSRGITLLALVILVAACGSARPTVSEWENDWNAIVALIPDESSLSGDPGEICESTLVLLRENTETLFPAPDDLIADSARQWLEVAEGMFFECPPADGFSDSYDQLDVLEAEIDAGMNEVDN